MRANELTMISGTVRSTPGSNVTVTSSIVGSTKDTVKIPFSSSYDASLISSMCSIGSMFFVNLISIFSFSFLIFPFDFRLSR